MTILNDTKLAKTSINPAALSPETAAKMLGLQVGIVQKHISQGAPVGTDGTINLIHYSAWLNSRMTHGY
ncbi:MAG: hypothetical protein A2Y10_08630 [Planctomycetes bacterium GWF2_41_51]|nr:MAG: hypothetical protein A2Y10_08630 [Planctomycetes bacterium GWF2_41_51]HBG28598.1 hypothetical protein [Phycisphaerales bacterium]